MSERTTLTNRLVRSWRRAAEQSDRMASGQRAQQVGWAIVVRWEQPS